ncbi:fimbrial protein [Gallibacterium trehalosifermentans]|uniref:Fimbrial protein n=1 Tax=Gallibacterium trehalosifermentans TaxID=516935 RepID=A0ABV6GYD1_9PAST
MKLYRIMMLIVTLLTVNYANAADEYLIGSAQTQINLTLPSGHTITKARDNWTPLPSARGNGVNQNPNFWGAHESPALRPTSTIEAQILLEPTGYTFNGLPIFKIPGNDYIGIVVYIGDTRKETGFTNTNKTWQRVFSYGGNSSRYQGMNVFFRSVMYDIPQERIPGQTVVPALTNDLLVGYVRSQAIYANAGTNGVRNGISKEIPIYLKPYNINYTISSCTMTSPETITVKMPTISKRSLDNAPVHRGLPEVFAGFFDVSVNQCGVFDNNGAFLRNDITSVRITFTDATDPSNEGSYLNLTKNSTAKGVGIRIYPVDGPFWQYQDWWIKFGPDTARINDSQKGLNYNPTTRDVAQRFIVKYAKIGDVTPGTVNATATFTFSYQ